MKNTLRSLVKWNLAKQRIHSFVLTYYRDSCRRVLVFDAECNCFAVVFLFRVCQIVFSISAARIHKARPQRTPCTNSLHNGSPRSNPCTTTNNDYSEEILFAAAYVEHKFANIALFEDLYANVVRKMESVFESYLGGVQDGMAAVVSEPDDIPKTNDPVYILGKRYCAIQGKPAADLRILCACVFRRLWFCLWSNYSQNSDTGLFVNKF